ncbi:MAG: methyltransferase [Desulfovibrio sp.]|nr:methyltransferase [Desulfovibrio sp.]
MPELASKFPRGLSQVENCHFASDSLLLARFADRYLPAKPVYCAELGCGCAAVLCGLALLRSDLQGVGFEIEREHIHCAENNLRDLSLTSRLKIVQSDLRKDELSPYQGLFTAVLANPPFFESREGRPSHSLLRNQAQRGELALTFFTQKASSLLRHHGLFFCIYPAYKLQELSVSLAKNRLGLRTLLPVASFPESPCRRVLVCASKNAAAHCVLLPPLVLHVRHGEQRFSDQALTFCPWLGAGHQTEQNKSQDACSQNVLASTEQL